VRLAADCLAVGLANLGAFVARFDLDIPQAQVPHLVQGLPLACVMYLLSFLILRTYRSIWEYASVDDLWQVIKAVILGASFHAGAVVLLGWRPYPRSVFVLTAILTLLLMGGMRLLVRLSSKRQDRSPVPSRRRVVIVGAGRAGESIAREILRNPGSGYEAVGFLDDDIRKIGETIHNLPVLGGIEQLPSVTRAHSIEEVIIAIPTAKAKELRRITAVCETVGIEFKTLPSLTELVRGDGKLRYLRPLDVEDLLQREPTRMDEVPIRQFLAGKRVMVTGAGGSIGSELCRQVLKLGAASLIMVERAENALYDIALETRERYPDADITAALADIKHISRMSKLFQHSHPHIVFHAAAYKHVPILEEHPGEAVLNNIVGTKRLSEVARRSGVETFVLISTDKAVEPRSLMGATKKICEMYVVALNRAVSQMNRDRKPRFVAVRFGNVLGSAGSVVPLFQKQIENGDSITITDPGMSRFFMTIREAVSLVLQSASMEGQADVFVLNMGEPVKISTLADDVVACLGLSRSEVGRRYVGLRAGEKMDERLWDEDEDVVRSDHEKIFMLQQRPRSLQEMESVVTELEELAIRGNVRELLQRIHEMVPSYRPSHSEPLLSVSGGVV
jgi:FlaA1/EpsC-like NDP-sugar epimerase